MDSVRSASYGNYGQGDMSAATGPLPEPCATPTPVYQGMWGVAAPVVAMQPPMMVPPAPLPAPEGQAGWAVPTEGGGGNSLRDSMARGLRDFGAWMEGWGFGAEPSASISDIATVTGAGSSVADITEEGNKSFISGQIRSNTIHHRYNPHDEMNPIRASGVEPGPISKFFSAAGHVVDAVTNVGGIAVEFKRDYDRGEHEYHNTQKEVIVSGAQLITSAVVGGAVTAVTGIFAGAMVTASVPVAVGIAAGLGAGYLIGKGADYIRSIWKD